MTIINKLDIDKFINMDTIDDYYAEERDKLIKWCIEVDVFSDDKEKIKERLQKDEKN